MYLICFTYKSRSFSNSFETNISNNYSTETYSYNRLSTRPCIHTMLPIILVYSQRYTLISNTSFFRIFSVQFSYFELFQLETKISDRTNDVNL